MPALVAVLKDGDSDDRYVVATALARIGPDARAAVPALAVALKDQEPAVRRHAAQALREIGPDSKVAVPELAAALKDEHAGVRIIAAQTLRAYPRMNPVVWETSGILSSLSWVNSILGQALSRQTAPQTAV